MAEHAIALRRSVHEWVRTEDGEKRYILKELSSKIKNVFFFFIYKHVREIFRSIFPDDKAITYSSRRLIAQRGYADRIRCNHRFVNTLYACVVNAEGT